jgi:hypothetical protein
MSAAHPGEEIGGEMKKSNLAVSKAIMARERGVISAYQAPWRQKTARAEK